MRVDVSTELDAMRQIVAALNTLSEDDAARGRVLRWVADRYGSAEDAALRARIADTRRLAAQTAARAEQLLVPPSVERGMCRCGRVELVVGADDVIIGDGSRHTLTGCHPPPVDTSTEGEEDQ